jgi:hypothetical protein
LVLQLTSDHANPRPRTHVTHANARLGRPTISHRCELRRARALPRPGPVRRTGRGAADPKAATAPVTTAGNSGAGAVIELSPFQVSSDADRGYLASNTLSGTRLNSKLEDLGASITVVTKQQMLDTAVLDINDLFLYEANTEGIGTFTSLTVDRNGGVTDNVQSSPQTANRIRGLDTANTARDNFASISSIPLDLYNTESAEISRGPNSSIFGLGNASGTINTIPTHANATRDVNSFTLRGDNYGGFRSSLDLNRPLLRNKLAVRLSGVYQSTGYRRKPSTDQIKRQQGTVTYKPLPTTSIYATYESFHQYARRPNATTPRDSVTDWVTAGRPTWDPTTQQVTVNGALQPTVYAQSADGNLPLGLFAQGTGFYNRPSIFVDNGAVAFWTVNRTGTVPTSGTFANVPTPDNPNTNLRYLESGNNLQRQRATLFPCLSRRASRASPCTTGPPSIWSRRTISRTRPISTRCCLSRPCCARPTSSWPRGPAGIGRTTTATAAISSAARAPTSTSM